MASTTFYLRYKIQSWK